MDNKKRIVNLEYFREMLHICPRLPGQTFNELPFEEEILSFLRFLRHDREIRRLTDINIKKLHQPWRSFTSIINKCLSEKSTSYDSLRLSHAQILWGLYHKKNVDFSYLLWEDFIYQVEHKDAKKSNKMYYPRFTKVIIHYFMTKDPSIPTRNKVNWHYVRDDQMFTTIKLVSRHQNTQQFGVMFPIELTNKEIRNSEAYKEYYAVASGSAPPKTKASVRKTKSSFDTSITPPTTEGTRLLQQTHISQASGSGTDEGTGIIPGVLDVPTEESDEEISWKSSDEDDDDDVDEGNDDDDDQDDDDQDAGEDDDDDQDEGNDDDQDSDEEGEEFIHPKLSVHDEKETKNEESFDPIAKTSEHSDDEGNDDENLGLNVGSEEGQDAKDDEDELYRDVNINLEERVVQMADVHITQEFEDTHVTLTLVNPDGINSLFETTSQIDVQALTTVASLTLFAPTLTPSTIATISTVPQAPPPPTTATITLLQDLPTFGSLFGFDHRLKTLEANFSEFMQTNQFVGAISSILGIVQRYMDQQMNEAVKVAVQIQSDRLRDEAQAENKEFLKNLDENIQKIIKEQVKEQIKNPPLDQTGGPRDEEKEKSQSQQALQRRKRLGQLASLHKDTLTPELLAGPTYELMKGSCKSLVELKFFLEEVYKATTYQLDWNNTEGHQYPHNLLKPLPLIPNSRESRPISYDKHALWGISHWGRKRQQFYGLAVNRESARDVYSKRRIIAVTDLQIVEWHNYKHLDWITVRIDDDKLYKFKEGDFKRLRIQDIEDMLLLLVQGKLTNLTVEERFAFNISLRMFTRSIVIQRRVKDLQLRVESYQKKLNLTKPDTYRSDLKRKEAYTAYSNPRGFIYQNKDKQNWLMRIDELRRFSDGTLNDVRTALDDHLKGIQIKYLPQTI
nr:hypothetical protein [Tanacetum cinerariifolium]